MYSFSSIIGQEAIKDHFQNALRTGSVSHAYIISGEKESGKELITRTFAAALQCDDLQERKGLLEPCGACLSCLQVQSGNQPDIIVWPRKEYPKYKVKEDIRAFLPDVQIRPYRSPWKIYILEDAETLNVQCQNALLKTLEEPPAYAVFFLLANGTENFLPTVLSRCVVMQIRQVEEGRIAAFLREKKGIPAARAGLCARFSRGNPGRALLLSEDPSFGEARDRTVRILREIPSLTADRITKEAKEIAEAGAAAGFRELASMWYRDILVYKSTGGRGDLIFEEEVQYISNIADYLPYRALEKITTALQDAAKREKLSVNASLTMEMLLLEIRRVHRDAPSADSSFRR